MYLLQLHNTGVILLNIAILLDIKTTTLIYTLTIIQAAILLLIKRDIFESWQSRAHNNSLTYISVDVLDCLI